MTTRELFFNVGGNPKDDVPRIQPDRPTGAPALPGFFLDGATPPNRMRVIIPEICTGGATVSYQQGKKRFRVILPPLDQEFQAEAGEVPQLPPEYHGDADKVALHYTWDDATLPILQRHGRFFLLPNGDRFFLKGKTGFNVPARFAYEGRDALVPMLVQSRELGYNGIRLWSAYDVPLIGRLIPRDIPRFYEEIVIGTSHLCAEHGQYPYWTGLTGAFSQTLGGMPEIAAHDRQMQEALQQVPFALYDRRNEYSKSFNQIDMAQMGPLFYDQASQGSGQQDEDPPTPYGRFAARHPGGSEWQRKVGKQAWDSQNNLGINDPWVDDETVRCEPGGETSTQHAFDAGRCGALFIAGAFYHSRLAKLGVVLEGTELETGRAFSQGADWVIARGLDVAQDGEYSRPEDPAFLRVYVKTLGSRSTRVEVQY